jgi:hypothetical protein
MKLSAQLVVLIALGLALVVTYSMPSDRQPIADPGTGPISEPHPITLRACAKAVIARAVIEDGLSLTEAAALLGEVDRLLPDPIPPIVGIEDPSVDGPPTSEAERLCRQAIRWIKARDGAAEVLARMEAEHREWLRAGTDRLPDPAGLIPSPDDLLKQARAEWKAECRGSRDSRPVTAGGFSCG